jgi:hypothetical protein
VESRTIRIESGRNLGSQDKLDVGRRIFLTGIGMVCVALIPFLQACDNSFPAKGEESKTSREPIPHGMRPSIDAAAPAKIQTATFSLG